MSLFGPYTGDSSKAYSYQIGSHWGGKIGYRVVEGFDSYRHFFGGGNHGNYQLVQSVTKICIKYLLLIYQTLD